METVFITVHDLSLDARIKYVSDSVEDILGYLPHEVKDKSCWEYFHPDEIPFARAIHGRGIHLDKAAVLHYCRIKHKDGYWVGVECVFTVVYDVLVASTSIYRRGPQSRQRAFDAPAIRRIFSSSPRDPRYHMLSYISSKFSEVPRPHSHEPRAALFLNRFTRTSTVMYATNTVASILGIKPEQLIGQSFYSCIMENCLQDAVRCLESAKANDSIAYLRFWYSNPLQDERASRDASMGDAHSSDDDDDDGGVPIVRPEASRDASMDSDSSNTQVPNVTDLPSPHEVVDASPLDATDNKSGSSSGDSTDLDGNPNDSIFDVPAAAHSSASSLTHSEDSQSNAEPVEVEAVVSCTSDGLVVILRRALPLYPQACGSTDSVGHPNGLFASPWATEPVMPETTGLQGGELGANVNPVAAPDSNSFMSAIRDVAVFAWSLTGINGSIVEHGRGEPVGEALPPGGLPIWDPTTNADPENKYNGFSDNSHRRIGPKAKQPLPHNESSESTENTESDDEVLYKRVPKMPEWRRPTRRAHDDAFGSDEDLKDPDARTASYQKRRIGP